MCQGYCAILPHEENLRFIVNVLLNEIFQRTEAITHLWYEIIFEESYLGGEILCKKKFVSILLNFISLILKICFSVFDAYISKYRPGPP